MCICLLVDIHNEDPHFSLQYQRVTEISRLKYYNISRDKII